MFDFGSNNTSISVFFFIEIIVVIYLFYQLIRNRSNMGYRGAKGYIEEIDNICSNKDCIFIIDNSLYKSNVEVTQMNEEILDYVYSNYNKIDSYKTLDVLVN